MRILISFLFLGLTFNTFAQIDPYTAVGLGASLGKGIFGKIKDAKKKKNIEKSLLQTEINKTQITILRVKEEKIISNAKVYITRIQNQLESYLKIYQSNQHIEIPYYLDDLSVLKSLDNDWPTDYYENEFKEYRKYEQALTNKEKLYKDSIEIVRQTEQRRISDSLSIVRKTEQENLQLLERVKGFHFINTDFVLLKEKPSEKSKTIGKIFLGSYVKVIGFSDNSNFIKVSLEDIEGYVGKDALVENINEINVVGADIATYKSRQYYKYEPNYEYSKEETISYASTATPKSNNITSKQTTTSKQKKISYSQKISYYRGPRGGCYYITSSGTKEYVDRGYCR